MSEQARVLTTFDADRQVAHVQLNRPEKRNGLDLAMFEGLIAAGEALRARADVRAVVLSGVGPSFSAGLDFVSFMASGPETMQRLLERPDGRLDNMAQRIAWVWTEVPAPVIAAVQGHAYGGGLQLALAADIRLVAPDAKLSVMEIKWGLIPDMTISRTLAQLVRPDVAKELTWTGRVFDGHEALRLGLATRLTEDPVAAALELAGQIAEKSPTAIRNGKRLYNALPDLDARAALALETSLQLELLGSANQVEAVQANFERRPAKYRDPE